MDDQADSSMAIFNSRLLHWLIDELSNADDDDLALRKALLGMLYVHGNQSYIRHFRDYLLRDFRPLADNFDDDNSHPFVAGQDIRLLDRADGTELLIHETLIGSIMKAPLDTSDVVNAGVRVPWVVSTERLVGCFILYDFYPSIKHRGEYANLAEVTAELCEAVTFVEGFGPWKDEPEGPLNYPGCWVRVLQLGDVIFVFSRDADTRSQIMMQLAAQSLFRRAVALGYGLRGGVAFGDCTVDYENSTFVGFTMFAARQLAGRQAWFGVAFDPSMDKLTARDDGTPPPPDIGDWLPITMPYPVPTGTGSGTEELSALNWPMFYKSKPSELNEFLEPLRGTDDPHFQSLLAVTKAFGHEMIRQMNMRRPT